MPGTTNKQALFVPSNTMVIAASVSNGGGAALAAAEGDTTGLIDGVVVGEPQINLTLPAGLIVARGGASYPAEAIGRTLYDYTSLANMLQPCAAHSPTVALAPLLATVPSVSAQLRCAALAINGDVTGIDFISQSNDALARLRAAGWEVESDLLHASHWGLQATPGVAVTYANAYSRASVVDNLCGFSFATTTNSTGTGVPAANVISPMLTVFGNGNGVPPTNGINLVYNDAIGGPIDHRAADNNFAFLGAQCLRQLWTVPSAALQSGVNEVRVTGNLRAKPTIIVHGRSDALVPVNHTSRPYFGTNKIVEGAASRLSYIEVLNGQHFDAFLSLAGYDTRFIPLHHYATQALNLMWNHLRTGAALPVSQVVRAVPRGGTAGAAPPITTANVPPIVLTPTAADVINFSAATNTVQIPN